MNPLDILYGAAGAWLAAALAGLLAGSRRPRLLACCALSALGGAAALAGGGWSLIYGDTPSAMTFSAPTRVTFDALYRPSVSVRRASDDDPAGRSGPVHYEAQVTPVFERYLYRPVIRAVEWLADAIRPLQSGDVNLYLLYVFAMILLAYLLGAV